MLQVNNTGADNIDIEASLKKILSKETDTKDEQLQPVISAEPSKDMVTAILNSAASNATSSHGIIASVAEEPNSIRTSIASPSITAALASGAKLVQEVSQDDSDS